jgi:hypothetical protein|tara:strand:+ start:2021 stop:2206 length:186 start_codon:yes stop_codon:yes gene_type:complete
MEKEEGKCEAEMRHHGRCVWEVKTVWSVHVGVGGVIVTDVDIVCLDCGKKRNQVSETPIKE